MDSFDGRPTPGFPDPAFGAGGVPDATEAPARPVISVSELNRTARQTLERAFGGVWVEGELSNVSRPRSGHIYFSLKDGQAQVRCAMFRGRNRLLDFEPCDGQQVVVRARVGFYEARGEFQLVVESMEESGAGELRRAFEALKKQLAAEGLFDAERKRPLPRLPNRVGVITSATGAALRDILTVLGRRFPAIEVVVYPVAVQGDEAAPAIVRMLELAARRAEVDVLLVGRGGGSLEDLWAFNEESVARAIAACPLPVVAAVGHETDVTIADFVADQRAATPSAAAELVSPDGAAWLEQVVGLERRLRATMARRLERLRERRAGLLRRLRDPRRRLQEQAQRLDELESRLRRGMTRALEARRHHRDNLHRRLRHPARQLAAAHETRARLHHRLERALHQRLRAHEQRLTLAVRQLDALRPTRVLERGYAILENDHGRVVRAPADAPPGTRLTARLASGRLTVAVVDHPEDTGE
ncbi:MAG: exodeoxyribonuclease VII large subunit [Pseudomonadota bacterium]